MHRADLRVRRADGRAPQVSRVDRAVRRRDADERALRRAGRRARQADLRRDPDQDADLAAHRAEGRRAVRVRRHAVRGRRARRVRHARARDRAALPPQVPAQRAADRPQGGRRGPRPVPDDELVDDGLLQRAARGRHRGGVHVRPRDPEAPARDVRVLHRADRRRRAARQRAVAPAARRDRSSGRAPGPPVRGPSEGADPRAGRGDRGDAGAGRGRRVAPDHGGAEEDGGHGPHRAQGRHRGARGQERRDRHRRHAGGPRPRGRPRLPRGRAARWLRRAPGGGPAARGWHRRHAGARGSRPNGDARLVPHRGRDSRSTARRAAPRRSRSRRSSPARP